MCEDSEVPDQPVELLFCYRRSCLLVWKMPRPRLHRTTAPGNNRNQHKNVVVCRGGGCGGDGGVFLRAYTHLTWFQGHSQASVIDSLLARLALPQLVATTSSLPKVLLFHLQFPRSLFFLAVPDHKFFPRYSVLLLVDSLPSLPFPWS